MKKGRLTFDIATKHIYDPPASDWTGRFELLLIGNGGDRDAARALADARLRALVGLHARLAASYLGGVA